MFITRKTDIHPAFGISLNTLFENLRAQNICRDPLELLNRNEYAYNILVANPEYIRPVIKVCSKKLYLQRELETFEWTVSRSKVSTIDTYLHYALRIDKINFESLSSKYYAISYLCKHLDKVYWPAFCENSNDTAIDILEQFPEKIEFNHLSKNINKRAIAILRENFDKINWDHFSENYCDDAVYIIREHPELVNYSKLSRNRNPLAIEFLKQFPEKIDWKNISLNYCEKAVDLLIANKDKINWPYLCCYAKTKKQFNLIHENLDKVDWDHLSMNSSKRAVNILKNYPDKINWRDALWFQPVFETITTYDYAGIREARHDLHQEFHAWAGHPSKMMTKWKDWGFDTYGMDDADEVDVECSW